MAVLDKSYRNSTSLPSDYEYEYDLETSFSTFYWDQLLPPLLVYSTTFIFGILGNALIIYTVFRRRGMKSATNVFLASLATADLLLLLACVPVKTAKIFSYSWGFGEVLCKGVHYLQSVSVVCSVLNLTAISVERCYAIIFPFRSKYILTVNQAQKFTAGVWLSSFVLSIPSFVVQVHEEVGRTVKAFWCHRDWDNLWAWRAHEIYMLVLVLLVPTVVMGLAYSVIGCKLTSVIAERSQFLNRQHSPALETHPLNCSRIRSRKSDSQDVKRIVALLLVVVLLFILCWSPLLITNVMWSWGVFAPYDHRPSYKHFFNAIHLLAYFNSCVNPVVYGFMSQNFRRSFYAVLCPCLLRDAPSSPTHALPQRLVSVTATHPPSLRKIVKVNSVSARTSYV